MGRALLDNQPLGISFTPCLYKRLLGRQCAVADLQSEDPVLFEGLVNLSKHTDTVDSLMMSFETDMEDADGNPITVPLFPGGSELLVTPENLRDYIDAVAKHRLATSDHIKSFVGGFRSLIPSPPYAVEELGALIAGLKIVNADQLISSFAYDGEGDDAHGAPYGYTRSSPQILWLHAQLRRYTQPELRNFLKFVTGTAQVPVSGFEYIVDGRQSRLRIVKEEYEHEHLPKASTCFFVLYLPEYPSEGMLANKLKMAITEGNEVFCRS